MKKLFLSLLTAGLLLVAMPAQLNAAATHEQLKVVANKATEQKDAKELKEDKEAKVLLARLNEIDNMDKSDLKISEKKELRKEVRSIKHKLKELGGGIYISAGAAIIILLLLLLLV